MKMTIAIPVWEAYGQGFTLLKRCLDSILSQTFTDFEIVVSDNSFNDTLKTLCQTYKLPINYFANSDRGMANNTNFAIKQAKGDLIKILYQDDYLAHEGALQKINDNFKDKDNWLITACSNNQFPFYSKSVNTLGSPSVMTIRNKEPLLFNDLKWTLDLDYYQRMQKKFGLPKILSDINVIIGLGEHQETNHLSEEIKRKEELLSSST